MFHVHLAYFVLQMWKLLVYLLEEGKCFDFCDFLLFLELDLRFKDCGFVLLSGFLLVWDLVFGYYSNLLVSAALKVLSSDAHNSTCFLDPLVDWS